MRPTTPLATLAAGLTAASLLLAAPAGAGASPGVVGEAITPRGWALHGGEAATRAATHGSTLRGGEAATRAERPALVPVDCDLPALGVRTSCARLDRPENPARPGALRVSLFVARLHARSRAAAEPVVFLSGGPGEAAVEASYLETLAASRVLERRDIVVLDQRGTGRSAPRLDCPEIEAAQRAAFGAARAPRLELARTRRAAAACRARLMDAGMDLGAYDTAATAGDVAALRLALGAPRVDLWGISYGTRAALATLRGYPEAIRAAVLDSVAPPSQVETPVVLRRLFDGALARLARSCRAERACRRRHPDVRRDVDRMVARFNARPVRTTALIPGIGRRPIVVTGDDLAVFVVLLLKETAAIATAPDLVGRLAAGDRALVRRAAVPLIAGGILLPGGSAIGQQLSVDCGDRRAGSNAADRRVLAHPGELSSGLQFSSAPYCGAWNVPPAAPAFTEPVRSAAPALLIAGTLDPVTPIGLARGALRTLPNGVLLERRGAGHGSGFGDPRTDRAVAAFLRAAPAGG